MIKIEMKEEKKGRSKIEMNRNERIERRKQNGMKWTDNNIGESGAMKIGEALMTNNALTILSLHSDDRNIKWKKKRKEKKQDRNEIEMKE